MTTRYIIAKPYRLNVLFYEGRQHMADGLTKNTIYYKKRHNAQKTLERLHSYDGAWIIVEVSN